MHSNPTDDSCDCIGLGALKASNCNCTAHKFSTFPNKSPPDSQSCSSECILAPVYIIHTHDIQIIFGESLDKVTYTLYCQPIWAICLHGTVKSLDASRGILELVDQSNKSLQIELDLEELFIASKLSGLRVERRSLVSVVCRVLHVVVGRNAYIRFKAEKINGITRDSLHKWDRIVSDWRNRITHSCTTI
ncbi:hypothetical protein BmR1_04g09042 [Babesia microti strain RI]|uniref:CST complex subunit CTC1 n=1 Tax=Babesia microti (strain RI) TaxID=1133968 RepID=A0A1N6LY98_BABMR|nr:hypothetical protein BmR1_04g09042 [Babesia microti strain RI]SIO73860.1 hypothetical protein BmR1_04g09042 [Babesia microti strain RI]|eukprot:XP_021337912.1 hypothetical protein BmR1_04g09042 [Babesia microti strain RI]